MTYARPAPLDRAPTPAEIEGFVHDFYARVRDDAELGPVFAARIEDWDVHLGRMVAFWTTVLHGTPAYVVGPKGPPPAIHRAIAELRRDHFETWLRLFRATLEERLGPRRAAPVLERARRMARALSAHLPPEARA